MAGLAWLPKRPTVGPSRDGLAAHAETGEGDSHGTGAATPVAEHEQWGRWTLTWDDERGGGVDQRAAHRRGKLSERDPGA
jgi:hypothetical protein